MSLSNGWIPKVLDIICDEIADHDNDIQWLNTPSKFRSTLKRNIGMFCEYISLVQRQLRETALQRVEAASKPFSWDKSEPASIDEVTTFLLQLEAFARSSQEILESTASFASLADNDKMSLLQSFAPQMLLLQCMKNSRGPNNLLTILHARLQAEERSLPFEQLTYVDPSRQQKTTLADFRKRLIPHFDELNPDDVELALLATISLWNPQAVSNAAEVSKVSRVQQLSMFLLQRYTKENHGSKGTLRFGNLVVFVKGLAYAGDNLLRGFRMCAEDGMIKSDSFLSQLLRHYGLHAQPEETFDASIEIAMNVQPASNNDSDDDFTIHDSESEAAAPNKYDNSFQQTAPSISVDNDACLLLGKDSWDFLPTDTSRSPYDPLATTEELIAPAESLRSPSNTEGLDNFCRWFERRDSTVSSNSSDSLWNSSSDGSDWQMYSLEADCFGVPLLGLDCHIPLSMSLDNSFLIQF